MTDPAASAAPGPPTSRWRRLRSIEGAAVAGILAAAGWAVALVGLLGIPGPDASDAEIEAHYAGLAGSSRALIYLQVMVVATIAFLWFVGVIRHRIGIQEPKLFGTVFLGSGILLAGLLFVGVANAATPAVLVGESDRVVDADLAASTRITARIILAVIVPRIASVFIISTSTLALRTGTMSTWFVTVSYLTGFALLLNVTFAEPSIYVFPIWMAAVSLYLLLLSSELDDATPKP
ncbi:MAG: hypothetical protein ACR2QO_19000 [Acidimicrobiales bacterium]